MAANVEVGRWAGAGAVMESLHLICKQEAEGEEERRGKERKGKRIGERGPGVGF